LLNTRSETNLSACRKNAFAAFSLCILILLIYSNTFDASWHFDDFVNIVEHPGLHLDSLEWSKIKATVFAKGGKLYRPVSTLSLALNYYFGKENVFGYHLINTLIHFVTALFLFLFIHGTLNIPALREKYQNSSYSIALLATVLWAINPVQTQAVTYIVQRMASLAGLFYIMTMFFYLKARVCDVKSRRTLFYAASGLCFILSLGSKENSITLPLSLLLYELMVIRRALSWSWLRRHIWSVLGILLVTIGIGLVLMLLFEKGDLAFIIKGYDQRPFTLVERLLTEPRIVLFYITLLLYPMPARLCITHDILLSHSILDPPSTLFAILILLGLTVAAILCAKRWPLVSYCVIFFLLNHILESSVLPLELIFEHRNYIPSMLFFLPISLCLVSALSSKAFKKSVRFSIGALIVILIAGQSHAAYIRNFAWKTEETLWLDCIGKYPELWRPHLNLGKYYSSIGRPDKAIRQFNIGLGKKNLNNTKNIYYWNTYFNLGGQYLILGELQKALHYMLKAEAIRSRHPELKNNLGVTLFRQGKSQEAEKKFLEAIRYEPDHVKSISNLGALYLITGRLDMAKKVLESAAQKAPADGLTLLRLAKTHLKMGTYSKASIYAKRGLSADTSSRFMGLLFLAEIYAEAGMQARSDMIMQSVVDSEGLSKLFEFARISRQRAQELPDLPWPESDFVMDYVTSICRGEIRVCRDLEGLAQ
jgi:tetratricopeptide (TPR) repeat protein